MQRNEAGFQKRLQRQRQPRFARAGRFDRENVPASVHVERIDQPVAAGKERGGMPVIAHAQNDGIQPAQQRDGVIGALGAGGKPG